MEEIGNTWNVAQFFDDWKLVIVPSFPTFPHIPLTKRLAPRAAGLYPVRETHAGAPLPFGEKAAQSDAQVLSSDIQPSICVRSERKWVCR
jgi:hypothetical protein